ncbi:ZIP family metal transporter [Mycoplasmopsis canis]|uniref:ZIP family metal transporter n=1 Tax=Mycoplasmopsis canis TaxID=29555 RepID=UPI00025ACFF9|nr:ZIP family metal transporter [Mycoplasmopsis canis]EIE40192.1 metal cation transporter, ZIP family protein [Mycoplasmopsis canis UF33]
MVWIETLYNSLFEGTNNETLSKLLLILIFLAAMLCVPVLIALFLPFLNKYLKKNFSIYVYAFSTGFFIVLAAFGFLRESLENANLYVSAAFLGQYAKTTLYGYNILFVVGGLIIGIIFSFFVKFVISYKFNKKLLASKSLSVFIHEHREEDGHSHHHTHKHEDFIFNSEDMIEIADSTLFKKAEAKLKIIALLLLLTHRIPEGLLLGYNLSLFVPNEIGVVNYSITTAYFLSLILHLIPEEIVFYIRLKDAGYTPIKALLLSFLGLILFLPFMVIGMFVGSSIGFSGKALVYSAVAGIFLFTSLVEFFPEFYHVNFSKNKWILTIVVLFIGVILAAFVLSFHEHKHV